MGNVSAECFFFTASTVTEMRAAVLAVVLDLIPSSIDNFDPILQNDHRFPICQVCTIYALTCCAGRLAYASSA
jgi:hypothetical protein